MSTNTWFDSIESTRNIGKFFVDLTERLGNGQIKRDEDITKLADIFGLSVPCELSNK